MKKSLRKLKNRIISGLTAAILLAGTFLMPVSALAEDGPDTYGNQPAVETTVTNNAGETDSSVVPGSETVENSIEDKNVPSEVPSSEKDSAVIPDPSENVDDSNRTSEKDSVEPKSETSSEEVSENTSETPSEETSERSSEKSSEKNSETETLHTVMTEKKDAVELSVFTDYDGSEVEVNPAHVSAPFEGLEIVKAYVFTGKAETIETQEKEDCDSEIRDSEATDGEEESGDADETRTEEKKMNSGDETQNTETIENAEEEEEEEPAEKVEPAEENLYVKAEAVEELPILPKEKYALYTVENNELKDVIVEDITEETDPCLIDDSATGVALVKDTGYRHLNFSINPSAEKPEQLVTLDGMMPKNAAAYATDVTESVRQERESQNAELLQNTAGSENAEEIPSTTAVQTTLAAFDISISSDGEDYQPGEERPITVEISDVSVQNAEKIRIWHILDSGEKEEISDFYVDDITVRFTAVGFSIYEIVESPDPYEKVTSLKGFTDPKAQGGIILYYTDASKVNRFFTSTMNGNGALIETDNMESAVAWYFEKDEGANNRYYIYTMLENKKNYLKQVSSTSNNLQYTLNQSEATAIDLSDADRNRFFFKHSSQSRWLQHSGSGSGIRFFTSNSDQNNARIRAVYKSSLAPDTDSYGLDGQSYGLMYYSSGSTGYGFMADPSNNSEELSGVMVRTENGRSYVYVSKDNDVSMWTFHYVNGLNYTLSTVVDGAVKYLNIDNGTMVLVDAASDASILTVTSDSEKGTKITCGTRTIYYNTSTQKFAFGSSTQNDWLKLVKFADLEDDVVTYSASKIGVGEVADGQKVIVYTRVWDNERKAYDFYAIDHDGTLYPCFERGDDIMWLGDRINTLLWDFTEYHYDDGTPNYYYELQNLYSGKFLAPQIEDGQVLSDSKIGINLPGRKEEEYYSKIIAWDDPNYSYAGIKAASDCSIIESCPNAKAEDFYFAIMDDPTQHTFTKVNTISNDDYGIQMYMYDFASREYMSGKIGENDSSALTQGLLSTYLNDNGFPNTTLVPGGSLADLYDKTITSTGTVDYRKVDHLFLESTYGTSGYFEYDSCQNFATLVQQNGQIGSNFTLYKELGSSDIKSSTTMKHGQFFPYDSIHKKGKQCVNNPENLYSSKANLTDVNAGKLPETDPRKYEPLYEIDNAKNPNYSFGMELNASFAQTPNGKDAWDHDIIFEFTGDDDFWLYVDRELVIDLGGMHSALEGRVNFATGEVVVNGVTKTLRQVFEENYRGRNPSASDADVETYLRGFFEDGKTIFKDYSQHEMKIFYMERGKGASNLHMRFNLSYVTPGSVIMKKSVTEGPEDNRVETTRLDFSLVEFPYQIWYKKEGSDQEYHLKNDSGDIRVKYQNSTQKVTYKESYTPPDSSETYESVYFLNPGMSAEISFPSDAISYKIVECGVNHEVYDTVYLNGTPISGKGSGNRYSYDSGYKLVSERPTMVFENHIDPEGLRTLNITKQLLDESGTEISPTVDNTNFSYRLSLSNGSDDTLNPANMVAYNVKDPDGYLCKWNKQQYQTTGIGFVPTAFKTLDPEPGDTPEIIAQKEAIRNSVTFETSMNGSISRIPAKYEVEVPNLPVGTRFRVEEREEEIPLGYEFVRLERVAGTYHPDGTDNGGWVKQNESPTMTVVNERGWEIQANKEWSDQKYIADRAPIYTAVYVNDVLKDGSVKQITYSDSSVRYFFNQLDPGVDFEDYKIFEVELTDPVVNPDGSISYSAIRKVEENDLTPVRARTKTGSTYSDLHYAVNYERGTASKSSSAVPDGSENVRTDTITNTRSGGIVMTLYKMGTTIPLADGIFKLERFDSGTGKYVEEGQYTSDSRGRITILYEHEKNTDYRLTEIQSPKNYIGLPDSLVFRVDDDDNITMTGNPDEWQSWEKAPSTDKLVAYIKVFNKPYTLEIYKYDGETTTPDGALESAFFSLYRGVEGFAGIVKDYTPVLDDLETDENGRIPSIDNELVAGRYFLTEKIPPAGYTGLEGDVVFDITPLGGLNLVSTPSGSTVELVSSEEGDTIKYLLKIANVKEGSFADLKVKKNVSGSMGNKAKNFAFTFETKSEDTVKYNYVLTLFDGTSSTGTIQHGDTFYLSHGDEIKFTLPQNTKVKITESSEESEGYVTTLQVDAGAAETVNSKEITITKDTEFLFTNTRDGLIPTGVWMPLGTMILLALICLVGGLFSMWRARRYYSGMES